MQEQQLDVFNALYPHFRFEKGKPIRLVECFAGIGFQAMGLQLAEIPYEVVATSEIDKHAIKSYEAIHGHNPNLGSITDIKGSDLPKDIDILTYSFPCTDLSKAGQQKGLENTRSGLVYEVFRILDECKEINNMPKVLIMENVIDLVQKRFINEFNEMCKELEEKGYRNFWQVLNSKDYGIPQNRRRVFMVSILGEYSYDFPKPIELTHKLQDYLEDDVDEKFYLSDKMLNYIVADNGKWTGNNNRSLVNKTIASTINTREGGRRCDASNYIADNLPENYDLKQDGFLIKEKTKLGYKEANVGDGIYINRPHQKRGVVQKGMIQTLKTTLQNDLGVVVNKNAKQIVVEKMLENGHLEPYDTIRHSYSKNRLENDISKKESENNISPTLTTRSDTLGVVTKEYAIRKLTPRESGRLMGMNDDQIDRQLTVTSNAQAYKQHGNGIVAQVIGFIVGMMYYEDENQLRETIFKNSYFFNK